MSSESNGQKPESAAPPSGVVHRVSARAPSAWGAVRDALAALHNIAALLRNSNVPHRTILELIPELRSSGVDLRAGFDRPETDPAAASVGEYGGGLVVRLDALLDALAASVDGSNDRERLASSASSLADELEACADLLTLLDRAAAPASTEVSLNLIARESGRMSGATRGREMIVKFQDASPDCVISTDPYILGQLLSLMAAFADAAGIREPVLRARSAPEPRFVVEGAQAADGALPALALRVTPWVSPSAAAARRVAEQVGAVLGFEDVRCSIVLGMRPG
jgi:hypothetical protein